MLMNVSELIEELKKLPPLLPVRLVVCRSERSEVEGELQDVNFQGNHIRLEASSG